MAAKHVEEDISQHEIAQEVCIITMIYDTMYANASTVLIIAQIAHSNSQKHQDCADHLRSPD